MRGLAVPTPITQAALELPQFLLFLQSGMLPLPASLSAEVLLSTQPSSRLGNLKLQSQLAFQAA